MEISVVERSANLVILIAVFHFFQLLEIVE